MDDAIKSDVLDSVRLSLRYMDNTFDSEILELIAAAKADLKLAGVGRIETDDPLILRAITLYVKGNWGYAEPKPQYLEIYKNLKISLCLAGAYRV
jgi:hypothetical protein